MEKMNTAAKKHFLTLDILGQVSGGAGIIGSSNLIMDLYRLKKMQEILDQMETGRQNKHAEIG